VDEIAFFRGAEVSSSPVRIIWWRENFSSQPDRRANRSIPRGANLSNRSSVKNGAYAPLRPGCSWAEQHHDVALDLRTGSALRPPPSGAEAIVKNHDRSTSEWCHVQRPLSAQVSAL